MSYPILYLSDETNFESNGLGVLSDCITCEVTEERNGSFELIMQYPITGIHYDEVVDRAIIKAKPNQINNEQLFRVYRKSKPMSGVVTIAAAHISYDLSGIPCTPFTASGVADAILKLKNQTATNNPFEFTTDKTSTVPFSVNVPKSVRACMGGSEGSILDVYGGEFLFDNYTISLYNERGMDRGVVIKYGKNLIDINQEENCSNVYTGIYPYYVNPETGKIIEIPQKILNVDKTFNFTKIKVLDFSNEFEEQPSPEELELFSVKYLQNNDISTPDVSLNVSFVQLEQSEEYKGLQLLESVYLCDTVTVEFPELGVNTTAKATKIVYDVLLERVKNVHLGSIMATFIDTVTEQKQEIEKIQSPTYLQQAVNKATNWITSGGGYMVAVKDENGQWKELLSLDTADIESAKSVWRWNNNGFGHSSTGYVGPFTTAITQDGQIVADFITTGTLNANIIKSGIISSVDGGSYFDLSSGLVHTNNAEFFGGTIGGWNINEQAIYKDYFDLEKGARYRAYYQAPGMSLDTDDIDKHMILSSQYFNLKDDVLDWSKGFYLEAGGTIYANRFKAYNGIETNVADKNTFAGLTHHRNGDKGTFGIGGVGDLTTIALEHETGGIIDSRFDFYSPFSNVNAILSRRYNGVDSSGNPRYYTNYLTFFEDSLAFFGKPDAGTPENCIDFMCKNIASNQISIDIDGTRYDVGNLLKRLFEKHGITL